jgi:hypothetical protein
MAKAAEASEERRMLAVEVRTADGPVFRAVLIIRLHATLAGVKEIPAEVAGFLNHLDERR